MIVHKELGGDYIHNPHKIIQVDILDKKYRLEDGLVAHFGEQDDYELVEQNPAWSEEDEKMLEASISFIKSSPYSYSGDTFRGEIGKDETENWLKSLKDRVLPQPKKEWSKEDEYYYNIIQYILNNECVGKTDKENAINWFKSLRHQSTWEPSDEQMDALYTYIYNPQYFSSPDQRMELVESVYKDLKKLREK